MGCGIGPKYVVCSPRFEIQMGSLETWQCCALFHQTKYRNQRRFLILLARGAGMFPEGETLQREESMPTATVNVRSWKHKHHVGEKEIVHCNNSELQFFGKCLDRCLQNGGRMGRCHGSNDCTFAMYSQKKERGLN